MTSPVAGLCVGQDLYLEEMMTSTTRSGEEERSLQRKTTPSFDKKNCEPRNEWELCGKFGGTLHQAIYTVLVRESD